MYGGFDIHIQHQQGSVPMVCGFENTSLHQPEGFTYRNDRFLVIHPLLWHGMTLGDCVSLLETNGQLFSIQTLYSETLIVVDGTAHLSFSTGGEGADAWQLDGIGYLTMFG
jgi:hypothetical protein